MHYGNLVRTHFTLSTWLEAWLLEVDIESELFDIRETTIVNPFTGKPESITGRGNAKGITIATFGS
jgi:hypothetical protein